MTSGAMRPGHKVTWTGDDPPIGDSPVEQTTLRLRRIPLPSSPAGDGGADGTDPATDGTDPATGGTENLDQLVRRGAMWTTLNVALSRFGQFGVGILVARMVAPEDFGVFAVALTVLSIVINVSELGVSAALVRGSREECRRIAPTVATISIGTAVVLSAVMVGTADVFARALGSAQAAEAVRVLSITVLVAGFGAVPSALLKRDFAQDKQFMADSANTVVSAVVVVLLAVTGWGAMALAWSRVAGQVVSIVLLRRFTPEHVRPGFSRTEARRLLAFGLPLTGANVIAFTLLNVDYIVIGRLLGAVQLGLYMLAFNMSGWPINVFSAVVRAVSMPAFARVSEDREQLPTRFAAAASMVATITIPVCLIMGGVAGPLVAVVYGSKWQAAAGALVGLAIFGAARTMVELLSDFLVALGRTRAIFIIQVVWIAALVPAMIIGVRRDGIVGAGTAHAVVIVGVTLPIYVLALRPFRITPWLLARAIGPQVLAAGAAGTVSWLVASAVAPVWLALPAASAAGFVVFAGCQWSQIVRVIGRLRSRRDGRDGGDAAPPDPAPAATGVEASEHGPVTTAPARTGSGRHRAPRGGSHGPTAWLDGARGLAAMYVVLHHCWLAVFPSYPRNSGPWFVGWMLHGQLAVVVFIVLSGYSLSLSPARNAHRLKGGWRTFARRRAWRILPPYWVALVISMPVALWVGHDVSSVRTGIRAFIVHMFMLQDVVGTERPNGTFWSIAVESWIYVLFPILLLLRRRVGPVVTVTATVIAVCGLEIVALHVPGFARYEHLSPQMLACFALGMLAADSGQAPTIRGRRVPLLAVTGLLIAGCVAGFAVVGSERVVADYFWVGILVGGITAVAFRGIATAPASRVRDLLASRPLTAVGMFAFSIYLIHPLVLEVLWLELVRHVATGLTGMIILLAVTIPAVLAVCFGFFKLFEEPFIHARSWADVRNRGKSREPGPARLVPPQTSPTTAVTIPVSDPALEGR